MKKHHNTDNNEPSRRFVAARFIAKKYGISERQVLLMAAAKKIPSLRIGPKCIRFLEDEVADALEDEVRL